MERETLEAKAHDLFCEMVEHALKRIRSGDATAAELEAARKIVRDAGVRYQPSAPTNPTFIPNLPFAAVDDEVDPRN